MVQRFTEGRDSISCKFLKHLVRMGRPQVMSKLKQVFRLTDFKKEKKRVTWGLLDVATSCIDDREVRRLTDIDSKRPCLLDIGGNKLRRALFDGCETQEIW